MNELNTKGPEFQLLEAFRRNIAQRMPELAGRVILGRRAATKKTECPRVCIEYLTDISTPFTGSRSRRVETTAHIEIVVYEWVEESHDIEERMLGKFSAMKIALCDIMREMMHGKNCPDGFRLLGGKELRSATASTPVNSGSRIAMYGYDAPNLTYETLIGEN